MRPAPTAAGRLLLYLLIPAVSLFLPPALRAAAPLALPASFAGELPCGDCTGQRILLTLFDDRTYRLRRTYLGATESADKAFYELGRWAETGGRLVLNSGAQQQDYRILTGERLRLLEDAQGDGSGSAPGYTLARLPAVDPVAGPMRLRGLYFYMADAATFTECRTGKRYPVSPEGANRELESTYLELARANPGAPLLATLDGRFSVQAVDPAAPPREHLVVEQFERFWPGETCAQDALSRASLYNTYWRPVEIDGEPVPLDPQQREPHFILAAGNRRVKGTTGCNRLAGSFERDADGLRFTALTTTRMACPPAAARLEARFLDALNATASQRILGESLELDDAAGQLRMRLESRYLH